MAFLEIHEGQIRFVERICFEYVVRTRCSPGYGARFPAFLGFALLAVGCGPKVDCDKLDKSLSGCTEALMFRLRPDAKKSLAKATDPETRKQNEALKLKDIERNRETLKRQVVAECRKHKGRAADAKLINACLEASGGNTDAASCTKFADCFGKFLKEKSK